ncbi:hypothetical protein L198_00525 [Cryptococcus wingfieldii CBS 7118]|uniref:Uncharacterized protein n=1 Tax=Cryptococcus wingfieldii CBS 7118 TaxID=1295528 RepID=A0A1E3K967_9TREE|nr:hypothetical protein L198_00525 [Cryptococcus wingfieldii CBS 7118]ODO08792.1 hypothetical protein L198_00525 [Cryptococcus wingfieldii CBS 7118]
MTQSADTAGYNQRAIKNLTVDFNDYMVHSSWDHVGRPMSEDYAPKNDGRRPPVGHASMKNWRIAQEDPWDNEIYDNLHKRLSLFGQWYNEEVLGRDEETCSGSM